MTTVASSPDSINFAVSYLSKSTSSFDSRFTLKILRNLPSIRKQVDADSLAKLIAKNFDKEYSQRLLDLAKLKYNGTFEEESAPLSPEVDAFVHLLVLVFMLYEPSKSPEDAAVFGKFSIDHLSQVYNRRSLDHFLSKIWFYYFRAVELSNNLRNQQFFSEMMSALRTASLRNDYETQSMLTCLVLRALIATNNISLAINLVSKLEFPVHNASNSLAARYHYYMSRVNAIELDYGTAYEEITAAIRKAPHTPTSIGFLQTANKLSVLIELLTGDIPPRKAFGSKDQPHLVGPLAPYLALAKAVRQGDINLFQKALDDHSESLQKDGNLSLARRLRQNVIKTGIRIISLTYSRISLKDVCMKLGLDSEESAEFIVAKAIRDNVIDAKINHQQGYMHSLDLNNVYSTLEPQDQYRERIEFCMGVHEDNVRSLRYVSSENVEDLKELHEAREREKELVNEIEETSELDDDEMDFDF